MNAVADVVSVVDEAEGVTSLVKVRRSMGGDDFERSVGKKKKNATDHQVST